LSQPPSFIGPAPIPKWGSSSLPVGTWPTCFPPPPTCPFC
jgi:hypothetical protein